MHVGPEPDRAGARRPGRRHASTCGAATSSAKQAGLPQNPYRWRVAMALLREAEGDLDAALGLLAEAERVYVGDFAPNVRPIPALRARMLAAHGDVAAALALGTASTASPCDDEPVLPARVRARDPGPGPARPARQPTGRQQALARRASGCSSGCWSPPRTAAGTGTVIEVLVLLALAHQRRRRRRARRCDGCWSVRWPWPSPRATSGSSPARASRWPTCSTALRRQRAGLGLRAPAPARGRRRERGPRGAAPSRRGRAARDGLVDPLTERELDVMRLLASDLDGPSIARAARRSR